MKYSPMEYEFHGKDGNLTYNPQSLNRLSAIAATLCRGTTALWCKNCGVPVFF